MVSNTHRQQLLDAQIGHGWAGPPAAHISDAMCFNQCKTTTCVSNVVVVVAPRMKCAHFGATAAWCNVHVCVCACAIADCETTTETEYPTVSLRGDYELRL